MAWLQREPPGRLQALPQVRLRAAGRARWELLVAGALLVQPVLWALPVLEVQWSRQVSSRLSLLRHVSQGSRLELVGPQGLERPGAEVEQWA